MSVGLDIGSKTIKVVELAGSGNSFSLKAAGAVGYSKQINIEVIKDDKELANIAQIIKKLFADAKTSSKKVSIAIPETQAFTRIMKFPLLSDQEIASAVKWEAEEYIPIPVKDAIIEHQILERQETGTPPQVVVLLVAVHHELVERYIKLLSLAGLEVVGVETSLMSLARSISPTNRTVVLADIGANSTNIGIARNKQLFFSRTIPTSGTALTRAVAQGIGVSLEQAEQYKRTYGLADDQLEGKVGQSISPVIRTIIEEAKKAIHYYQLESKGDKPSSFILSGGSAGLPGLPSLITKSIGTEVIIANPFTQVTADPKTMQKLASFAPLYSIAVGLAMRGD